MAENTNTAHDAFEVWANKEMPCLDLKRSGDTYYAGETRDYFDPFVAGRASLSLPAAGQEPPPIHALMCVISSLRDTAHFSDEEGEVTDDLRKLRDWIVERSAAPQPAVAAGRVDADLWYLQDTRSYVGNDVLWWAKDGKGYTTDVSKAHVYSRDTAFRQAAMRGTDRAWPKAYIDGKTRPAVDMQYIDHAAAIAALPPAPSTEGEGNG